MLKPCPWCNSTNGAFVADENQGTKWGSWVCECGIRGPEVRTGYDTSENAPWHADAAEEWNRRAPEPATTQPLCPECNNPVLFACVACSATNYPPATTQPERSGDAVDAARYRWLRDTFQSAKGSASVEFNAELAYYEDVPPGENVVLQWYPDTPIGFYNVSGKTLDEAIDAAVLANGARPGDGES